MTNKANACQRNGKFADPAIWSPEASDGNPLTRPVLAAGVVGLENGKDIEKSCSKTKNLPRMMT